MIWNMILVDFEIEFETSNRDFKNIILRGMSTWEFWIQDIWWIKNYIKID